MQAEQALQPAYGSFPQGWQLAEKGYERHKGNEPDDDDDIP